MEAAAKGQSPSAIISAGTVRLLRDYTGRGPTKAKTIIAHDSVMVVLADSLTKGERSLVESGKADHVLHTRQELQKVMRPDLTGLVESPSRRMQARRTQPWVPWGTSAGDALSVTRTACQSWVASPRMARLRMRPRSAPGRLS